jgi:FlaA1/EpsC-like NDP-sugar epimerase
MMHLMGRRERTAEQPDGEIELVFSGLRPGEKLFEELLIGDDPQGTAHPRIMMACEVCMTWPEVADTIRKLQYASEAFDCEGVLTILKTAPTGFAPNGGVGDLVWNLNPRSGAARATDKVGSAGRAGTDFKSVPRAGKEKLGQI